MNRIHVTAILAATALLLLIPLVAMQFTDEVVWTASDFAFAAAMLAGTGLAYEWISARSGNGAYRAGAAVGLGAALMLVWAAGAVGIIGVDGDPFDLLYVGVLAVGLVGAWVTRFEAGGMSRTLAAMAIAQVLVAGIALLAGKHLDEFSSVPEIVAVNAFFAALYIGSAALFRKAADAPKTA